MKRNYQPTTTAFAVLSLVVALVGCSSEKTASSPEPVTNVQPVTKVQPATLAPQAVTVTVDGEFKPAEVRVRAGQPVELTFETKNRACAKTVVFKSLGITKELTDGTKTVVSFTPKEPGKIEYACGMDMLKGSILVE